MKKAPIHRAKIQILEPLPAVNSDRAGLNQIKAGGSLIKIIEPAVVKLGHKTKVKAGTLGVSMYITTARCLTSLLPLLLKRRLEIFSS